MILFYILVATFLVSLISFFGIVTFSLKEKILEKILLFLVALSAGSLIGSAFLHLIPESFEKTENVFTLVLIGFALFYLLEKILHWRHCHKGNCKIHSFAYMNLVGDFFHNFLDGIIIASSFIINFNLGITTTLAIIIHEIPQEIGDFGVLVYGGFKKSTALYLNFATALTAIFGGLIGYFLFSNLQIIITLIPAIAAGGFIYIAASDLIPELKKDKTYFSILHFIVFLIGILIMYLLKE